MLFEMTAQHNLSLCSGIEAVSGPWQPLGWMARAFSEIDPFACALLERHFPDIPNLGDMSQINGDSCWPSSYGRWRVSLAGMTTFAC